MSETALINRHCRRETSRLGGRAAQELGAEIHSDWKIHDDDLEIQRTFAFKNYYQTIAFVNALAWIAHREDHHPELQVSYKHCVVHYSTHSVGGLSENDFICAAKIDALLSGDA